MQRVALGFLIFQMTGSPLWVGIIDAMSTLPAMFLSFIGGALADRYSKRTILRLTQFLQFVLGTSLGILVITDHATLFSIGVMVLLLGVVNAIDNPTRISIGIELVGKKDLQSATAINMSVFNSARIIGPVLAGWVIFSLGAGWAFLINGISFLAPVIAYQFIQFVPHVKPDHVDTWRSIKDGLAYVRSHRELRLLLLYMGGIAVFGWSYMTILPVLAGTVFHVDAAGLGYLFSAAGVGSVLGALSVSAFGRFFNPHKLIFFGGTIFTFSLLLAVIHPVFTFALVCLFFVGFGQAYQNSTIQTRIQQVAADHMRGRISSMQSFMTQGMQPFGSLQVGVIASVLGPQVAIGSGAVILFMGAIALFSRLKHVKR